MMPRPRHIHIRTCVSSRAMAELWGDWHFAQSLAEALRARNCTVDVLVKPEWDEDDSGTPDAIIHLRGLHPSRPRPETRNILWVISHPEDVTTSECEGYDIIAVASDTFASRLRMDLDRPVEVLYQATSPERFAPGPREPSLASPVLFVGNSRGRRRPAVDFAIEAGLDLSVYGYGWDRLIPQRFVRDINFPNERLGVLYRSSGVVLNDHWEDMVEHGFVSNRIFDVLASGGVVVSDYMPELAEMFNEAVPVFRSKEELVEVVGRILADPEGARRGLDGARELVLAHHTFAHRARALLALLEGM